MSVYLIDYENVHAAGLAGVEDCTMEDEIILFYGNSTSTISMDLHIRIASSRAKVQYHKIERTGKNYLDFQLSTIAGYLVGTTKQSEFVIVSKDGGFDAVLDFWNQQKMADRKLAFLRKESISGDVVKEKEKSREKDKEKEKSAKKRRQGRTKSSNKKGEVSGETKNPKKDGELLTEGSEKAAEEKNTPAREAAVVTDDFPMELQEESVGSQQPQNVVLQEEAAQQQTKNKPRQTKRAVKDTQEKTADKTSAQQDNPQSRPVEITEAVKKKIRTAVKELKLKPTDYTKIYKVCKKSTEKQDLHQNLVHTLKQELGTQIYKAIVGILF